MGYLNHKGKRALKLSVQKGYIEHQAKKDL